MLTNCRGNLSESVGFALQNFLTRNLRLIRDNVTCYVPNSAFVEHRLVAAGFPAERMFVIPNLVAIPAQQADPAKGSYAAYSGRFHAGKGIETLLIAARKADIPLRLAGDYAPMRETPDRAPPGTQFLGRLDHAGLDAFYRNARFLVVPSRCFETFGLVAAEAMAHGIPVIASRIGGLQEVVEDGVTGLLVNPGDSADLARGMTLLWENPGLCRQMGVNRIRPASRDAVLLGSASHT